MRNKIRALSFLVMLVMVVGMFPISASAAGPETLPRGLYDVLQGKPFEFTNYNLTPIKTMPAGASRLRFEIYFRKGDYDAGLGKIKLSVQIRNTSGGGLTGVKTVEDVSNLSDPYYIRGTWLYTDEISVYPGQQIQVWFDASSAGASNGNYRSAKILSFVSVIS